jgi:dipeptidyl aminopeptidase/acylaminoacyl peptidase
MEQRAAGTWPSEITPSLLVGGAIGIETLLPDGDDVWWSESRPAEGGRVALMRWRDGDVEEMTPHGTNVRTSVHEYGGGAWWAEHGIAYYVDFTDQRLRRLLPGEEPVFLTSKPELPRGLRFADGRVTLDDAWFVCVHERHHVGGPPDNEIVAVATDGSGRLNVLATGADFYASPRISPDGQSLVWIQWMHPNMPWDSTELWIADLVDGTTANPRLLVGNGDEALQEPRWTTDGVLLVATDRTDWWHVYAVDTNTGALLAVTDGAYDVVEPHWAFGESRFAEGIHVVASPTADTLSTGLGVPYSTILSLHGTADSCTFVGASYSVDSEPVRVRHGQLETLRPAASLGLDIGHFPEPEFITFPTSGGAEAYALYYAPANPGFECLPGERPPLLVSVHGGPTSSAGRQLSLRHRFWTSRGFAVVDVDYRGSSRYGRRYRNLLRGQWCAIDVDDAVAAAQFLAARGDVDPQRLAIRGGSAGGTTTLLGLALHDVFAAGANYFGVADLTALMTDDHKFESRYAVQLIGPYPEAADLYAERSPINHIDTIDAPLIILQGGDDTVVPPYHSIAVRDAMTARDLQVEYHEYPGEGHGFRGADAIIDSITSELAFYGKVFGFPS